MGIAPQFARFLLTAGLGWLADFGVFFLLTNLHMPPGVANVFSCLVGATLSWFLSVRHVFQKQHAGGSQWLMVYWLYVLVTIALFSAVLAVLVPHFGVWLGANFPVNHALAAKIFVTVPSVLLNFLVMRALAAKLRSL